MGQICCLEERPKIREWRDNKGDKRDSTTSLSRPDRRASFGSKSPAQDAAEDDMLRRNSSGKKVSSPFIQAKDKDGIIFEEGENSEESESLANKKYPYPEQLKQLKEDQKSGSKVYRFNTNSSGENPDGG